MIAGVLFLSALPVADHGAGAAIERTLVASPSAVEVGEPFSLVLEVSHPVERSGAELTAGVLEIDDSWILLDTRLVPARGASPDAGRGVTRRIWELASLEPGTRELTVDGLPPLSADGAGGETTTVEVAGVLGADEDEARPLRGFPPSFGRGPGDDAGPPAATLALGVGGALAALLLLFLARRWARRRAAARAGAERIAPLARWAELHDEEGGDTRRLRERHFALSRLLRAAVDEHLGRDRRGHTDEDWRGEVAEELRSDGELRAALEAALTACARVKYAGERPSSFAVEETFAHARRALELLESRPAPGNGTGGGS